MIQLSEAIGWRHRFDILYIHDRLTGRHAYINGLREKAERLEADEAAIVAQAEADIDKAQLEVIKAEFEVKMNEMNKLEKILEKLSTGKLILLEKHDERSI